MDAGPVMWSEQAKEALGDSLFASVPETAAVLRTDERTLRRALEAGEIPGVRVGQRWKIPTAWLRSAAGLGGDDDEAA